MNVVNRQTCFYQACNLVDKKHWVRLTEKPCSKYAEIANALSDEVKRGIILSKDDARKRPETMKLESGTCLELAVVDAS